MNTALLYFTLQMVEVQIDRQLDSPYVESCVQLEEKEFICINNFIED